MKKYIVIFLASTSWQTMPMYYLAQSALGLATPEPKQESKQAVQMQQQKVEQPLVQTAGGPTHINLTVNLNANMNQNASTDNKIETNSHSQSESNAQANASAKAQADTKVGVGVSQSMLNEYPRMYTLWDDNKVYFGVSALLALYSYYFYQVLCGNLYLKRANLWSSWKNGLSFDQLCAIPQQSLARELVLSIQHQGLDMQKPTDFTIPLVNFLFVIEQERMNLLYYQALYSRITMVKCGMVFPFNKKQYNGIEQRLQRLSFVKNIFISWLAEFNLEHAKSLPIKASLA